MKKLVNKLLKGTGYQLKSSAYLDTDIKTRIKIAQSLNIDVLLDVGANTGQYAQKMRAFGYTGKVVSFEPLSNIFEKLKQNSASDSKWEINNYALGKEDTEGVINIAGNMDSSSILSMLPEHEKNAPHSKYVGQQPIIIKRLDTVASSLYNEQNNVMLKIDTQGYEESVLRGAEKSLKHIKMLQLEMSIVPLYESEMLFTDMVRFLDQQNFCLYGIENGFTNSKTGRLLQFDGIFVNKDFVK